MSKKKNTLKDLDEFLKQQAASLVSPEKLSEKIEAKPIQKSEQVVVVERPSVEVTSHKILEDLKVLAGKNEKSFRKDLYNLILKSLDSQTSPSPEDMMLINTVLYLQSGDNWKVAIKEYWRKK